MRAAREAAPGREGGGLGPKGLRALAAVSLLALGACDTSSASTVGARPSSAPPPTSAVVASASPAEVLIPVDGMSCGSCAARLKRGLKDVDGVVSVEVTLDPGGARIQYLPGKTSPDRLVAAINALEFTAGTPTQKAP